MDSENSGQINRIRKSLSALEDIKNSTIVLLGEQTQLASARREMWISDIKELYYSCIAAWHLLDGASKGSAENAVSCRQTLTAAMSRMEQVASEIRSLDNILALWVESDLRDAFTNWYEQTSKQLETFERKTEAHRLISPATRTSERAFTLSCSLCGDQAATFAMETSTGTDEEGLVYVGICTAAYLDRTDKPKVFGWLAGHDLAAIHNHMKQYKVTEDGLDVYCPDCDKIYCRAHYNVKEEWDEGFYDYATGTCPVGHTRIIDD